MLQFVTAWLAMFKITQSTIRLFSLAEILLMMAINQMQARRKDSGHAEQG